MKSNTTRSIDSKILEILSNGESDYSSLKEKLDIPSSSLSTSLSKLKKDGVIEEFDQKKYCLIQNEELEEIILKQCPFDDVNELLKKIQKSKQQKTSKFAQDKKLLEYTLKKLEKLHLIEKSTNYELSKDGCAKIQFCVECKTPVPDGVTPIVLMDFDTIASYHYSIHPKCYSNWRGEHDVDYHNENYCDFCGLALEYSVLLNKYSNFNWVLTLQSFLDLNEKKHLENTINIQVLSELSLICKYKVAPNDVTPLSGGISTKKFSYEKFWNISVKLKPEYVNGLLDKFRSLDVSIFSGKNLGESKEIKSKKELDFKNENSIQLKFTSELWGKSFTFSNFEEFLYL